MGRNPYKTALCNAENITLKHAYQQASQWHELYCHDLEVMSSNPGWVKFGVRGTSVISRTWTKNIINCGIATFIVSPPPSLVLSTCKMEMSDDL